MSTGYGWEGLRQVCATLLGARHVPERLCGGLVYLEMLYQMFDLLTFTFVVFVVVSEDVCTVQQELVKRCSSLLQKYIRKDIAFELEALYAVQLIVHKHGHPYGLSVCLSVCHIHITFSD